MPHLLKRLELNGFKSFAGKTVLEFPAGITAIVGPNGSGKSNIIDAIRWLLGEREARNLRGGKGEDLIFAGTPQRPRVGQAEAALFFENHKKFFPVEFAEVSVSRRVNRSGVNDYFLNRSPVRLKDLVDLFAAARLGSRGMTVITQGNSDMVLRATPAERREMIEEVLGLKEYQIKKHEAALRLNHAQNNLEKAKALREEILPHLRSLRRQTSRWARRGELETELKELEDAYFGSHLRELEQQASEFAAALAEHRARRTALAEAKEKAEKRLAELEQNAPKERQELKEIKAGLQNLLERRSQVQKELGRLEARVELAVRRPETPRGVPLEKVLETIRAAQKILEDSLRAPEHELRQAVERALTQIKIIFKNAEDGADGKADLPPELSGEFEKVKVMFDGLEKEIGGLREKERALEKNQEAFYAAFKEAHAQSQKAQSALDEWARMEEEKKLGAERVSMRREELERQAAQAGRRISEFAGQRPGAAGGTDGAEPPANAEDRMFKLRGELAAMGEADEAVVKEARETEERYAFLERESEDLQRAQEDLQKLIHDLTDKVAVEFNSALHKINAEFQKFFELMFGGGTGKLVLEKKEPKPRKAEDAEEDDGGENTETAEDLEDLQEPQEEKEPGIDIKVALPRKRVNSLDALSGGERSLVGIATLFALISVSPPPFLVLDEIDAPLDERNARRFAELLREFSKETQFIIVTHNRATMEAADVLYGITLAEDGASKVLSVKLEG
jgi:chromosome segregation protein